MESKTSDTTLSLNQLTVSFEDDKYTPFMMSIIKDPTAALNLLKNEPKLDVLVTTNNGMTTVMVASKYRRPTILKEILHHSSYFNTKQIDQSVCCTICCDDKPNIQLPCQHSFHVHCLTRWTREFDAKTTNARCPNCSYEYKKMPSTEFINKQNKNHQTALHMACKNDNPVEIIQILLDANANPNIKDDYNSIPLQYLPQALNNTFKTKDHSLVKNDERKKITDVIGKMIECKANINNQDKLKQTVLHQCCRYDNSPILVDFLLKNNANINLPIVNGMTPLLFSLFNNNNITARNLINNKADVTQSDKFGSHPLMLATTPTICLKLIEAKANIEQTDQRHMNALLQMVTRPKKIKLIETLLKANSNPNISNTKGETPLLIATHLNHQKTFEYSKLLLEHKAYINIQDNKGHTPLMNSIVQLYPNINVVKLLIQQKAYLDVQSKLLKKSALMLSKFPYITQELIKGGARINLQSKDGSYPIHYFAESADIASIKYMFNHDSSTLNQIHIKNVEGNTPFLIACNRSRLDCMKYLVENKASVNVANKKGNTALFYSNSNKRNRLSIIEWLLSQNCDINQKNNDGITPLLSECMAPFDNHTIVLKLIESKADVLVKNKNRCPIHFNKTPLHYCAQISTKNTMNYSIVHLLKAKADINAIDGNHITPFFMLAKNNQHFMIPICMKYNCEIDKCDVKGQTPLIIATRKKNFETVRQLIKHKANINIQEGEHKDCALSWASYNNDSKTLKLILEHKPILENRNIRGLTALFETVMQDDYVPEECLKMLVEAKADINTMDTAGHTPLSYSIVKHNTGLTTFLLEKKANPFIEHKSGYQAIEHAILSDNVEAVRQLKKFGINPYRKSKSIASGNKTLLELANATGNEKLLNALLY